MGKYIDADAVKKKYPLMENDFGMTFNEDLHKAIDSMPPVEVIPKAEVRKLLKDNAEKVSNSILDIVKEEYIPKADYEARLKADLEAILTDLYMKIEELDTPSDDSYDACIVDCERLVQQKINNLQVNNSKVN